MDLKNLLSAGVQLGEQELTNLVQAFGSRPGAQHVFDLASFAQDISARVAAVEKALGIPTPAPAPTPVVAPAPVAAPAVVTPLPVPAQVAPPTPVVAAAPAAQIAQPPGATDLSQDPEVKALQAALDAARARAAARAGGAS